MFPEMKFEIYYDAYDLKKDQIIPRKLGVSSGLSFLDACEKLAQNDKDFARGFNSSSLTYKKRELYGKLI